jgi:hypothetical protein
VRERHPALLVSPASLVGGLESCVALEVVVEELGRRGFQPSGSSTFGRVTATEDDGDRDVHDSE